MKEFAGILSGIFRNIGSFFSVKLIPSFVIPTFVVFFGNDNTVILRALLFLVIFDFITGLISARKTGEVIKSKGIVRSAFKIAVYGLLVSSGHLTEQITPGATYIEEAVITFLALTELISIIENVGKMGYAIPRRLLQKLQNLRDEETSIKEKTTVKEKINPETLEKETHVIQEKTTETHIVEKPINKTNP